MGHTRAGITASLCIVLEDAVVRIRMLNLLLLQSHLHSWVSIGW